MIMKRLKLFLFVLVLAVMIVIGRGEKKVRYDNYRVYSVHIESDKQMQILKSLQYSYENYKFWKYPKSIGSDADIMVHPVKIMEFTRILNEYRIQNKIMTWNVQQLIDNEQLDVKKSANISWDSYYELDEIYNWLDDIQRNYSQKVTPFIIGKSFEGRNIRGIKISYKSGNPGIFLEANIHAREWIASATATFVINELLTSKDPEIRDIAENIDWYIIPVLNVDGFTYTHQVDRMWRKTRQPNLASQCIGVDPNRNFDSYWSSNGGASPDPCHDQYAGPKPFSEPETLALANYVRSIKDKISIYLAFHSYGQLILSPFGHTEKEFPPNYSDMQTISAASVKAIQRKYDTSYRYGSTASTLYLASGTSVDWVYNTLNTPLGYTFEFHDKGVHGFVLPPDQIKPNCEEAIDGIITMIKEARRLNYLK